MNTATLPGGDLLRPTLQAVMRAMTRLLPGPAAAEPTVVRLNKGATTWIARPRGRKVTCEAGTLWLCFDGELQDIVLAAGETHHCEKASRLSVHALSTAAVRLA